MDEKKPEDDVKQQGEHEEQPEAAPRSASSFVLSREPFLLLWALFMAFQFSWSRSDYVICSGASKIYTVDATNPQVQCIYVDKGKVMNVGDLETLQRELAWNKYAPRWLNNAWGPQISILDSDSIIVPGLTDAHAHILEYGFMRQLPLTDAGSVAEVITLIKDYIKQHPDVEADKNKWIEGMGWDQTKWEGKEFPTAAQLEYDPLLRDRPISLRRVDGHARWVSPRVLELMGELPAKVEGGEIIRDSRGKPTGIFVDNAQDLIPIPEWTDVQRDEFFETTMKDAVSHGLTIIHDADARLDHIATFIRKADKNELPLKIYALGHVESQEYWGDKIPHLKDYGKQKHLTIRGVKLYADGALGSWGAALLKPYSDKPSTSGLLLTPPETLAKWTTQFWKDGFQVGIHCIGDRANHDILDIYEKIITKEGANVTEWRPRIEHAQIFSVEDLERVGKLGVIASVQPTHATSDMSYAESRLGPQRIKGAYAYQTLLKNSPNHVLPLGSDFPVESINPLYTFYAAVTRLTPDGTSPHGSGGWYPDERLTREQALKGLTLDAAYASFTEDTLGSLTPGKKADFVILDKDIMNVPFDEILGTKVKATVVDGKVVYGELPPRAKASDLKFENEDEP